ncbi:MAG: dihydrolipoyl dehydrogenase [Planctomycetes bacterium]|nr:dihydrolipoyl dehydrogenase [Planctomycetota bacterium]
MSDHYDLLVIGGGPGGYVAAIRGAQLGLNVAVVEKEKQMGGTCLRVGCIPSKALLESSHRLVEAGHDLAAHGVLVDNVRFDLETMMARKNKIVSGLATGIKGLLKKNKVTRLVGHGRLAGAGSAQVLGPKGETSLTYDNCILATGSSVSSLPFITLDYDRIGTSDQALSYPEVPKHLVVIGAGVIGLELGSVWLRLGAKVTVLEYLDRIMPGVDSEIAADALKIFKKQGFEFKLGARVTGVRTTEDGEGCVVDADGLDPIECDRVLVSVGRRPNTDNLGLESAGVMTNERGQVIIDGHLATTAPGVYAIGDLVQGPMLAHKAEEEGIAAVERIVTGTGHVNYDAIPSVVYTYPEIASVGKTEEELQESDADYKKGTFPFAANGRAHCLGDPNGKVKVLADARTDRILGVHIIGPHAGDLIAEVAVAVEFGASSEDLARAVHAHPTLAETIKEAALDANRRAIHM